MGYHGGSRRRRRMKAMREMQTAGFLDDAYDSVAGAGDFLAGDIDESIARQFDDAEGGGLIDGFQEAVPLLSQDEETTQRQVEEGILDDTRTEDSDVAASSARIERTQNEVAPGGRAVQQIRIRNGLAYVSGDNPNRSPTEGLDIVSPTGAVIGIGGAAAAIGAGAATGTIAGPPGTVIGGALAAAGVAGSWVASEIEEAVGALGYAITASIDGQYTSQTVTSVGVPPGGVGANGKTVPLEHRVPDEPGEYTVDVVVTMYKTGEIVDEMEIPITVTEGAPSRRLDDENRDDEDDENGFNLVNFAKNNPGIAAATGLGALVAVNSFSSGVAEGITQ